MRTIKLHENISIVNGYLIVNNKADNDLFIEYDFMYSGSDTYTWFMSFILIGLSTHDQMLNRELINRSTRLGKFMSRLESALQEDVNFKLNSSYKELLVSSGLDKVLSVYESDKRFRSLFIINHMTLNNALIIELEVKGYLDTFSMLVTALETEKNNNIKTLYCLSPQFDGKPRNYWNTILKRDENTDALSFLWVDFEYGEMLNATLVNVLALHKH